MKRPKGFCPCCETQVEFYSDGMSGGGHAWRCGNCFQGLSQDQVADLEDLQKALQRHEEERQAILNKHLGV